MLLLCILRVIFPFITAEKNVYIFFRAKKNIGYLKNLRIKITLMMLTVTAKYLVKQWRFRVTDSATPLRDLFTVFKVSSRPIMRRMSARALHIHSRTAEIASRADNTSRGTIRRKKVRKRSRGSSPYEGRARVKSRAKQKG